MARFGVQTDGGITGLHARVEKRLMPCKNRSSRRKYQRDYYRKRLAEDIEFKAKHLAMVRRRDARVRQETRAVLDAFKAGGCKICEEKATCCLSAHHLDPSKKSFSIGESVWSKMSPAKVAEELKKCVCVCENCHRKIHAGLIAIPE